MCTPTINYAPKNKVPLCFVHYTPLISYTCSVIIMLGTSLYPVVLRKVRVKSDIMCAPIINYALKSQVVIPLYFVAMLHSLHSVTDK